MTVPTIKEDFKSFFTEVDTMAKERPLVTVIYAVALTIIAGFIAPYSSILALGVFAISLPFHLIVIKNFKNIYKTLEERSKDIFIGDPREKSHILGRNIKILTHQIYYRTIGFFEGLFSKNKDCTV